MVKIKTRNTVKNIKLLDKAAVVEENLRGAAIRTKDMAENLMDDGQISPYEYAEDKARYIAEETVHDSGRAIKSRADKVIEKGRRVAWERAQEKRLERKDRKAEEAFRRFEQRKENDAVQGAKEAHRRMQNIGRIVEDAGEIHNHGDNPVSKAFRTVKTTAGKTIAALKEQIAAIGAGSSVAVTVVMIILLICLITGSSFGIFFSGEDSGNGMTMRTVVKEINDEYQNKIEKIKAQNPHDDLELSGSRAVWPQVLSVYAVKTTTDPDNPAEVATMDEDKKQLLSDIFWAMNDISYNTKTVTDTVIVETDDGHGNILEEEVEKTHTVLYITVSHKTPNDTASQYRFDEDQNRQLEELLSLDSSMWFSVLYGVYGSDDMIVKVACSQLGNIGGEPYWSWYGFGSRVEWCACFVSWCADQCGYIDDGIIPKYAGCVSGMNWFKSRGRWADNSIEPTPGMIVFFDWDNKGGSGNQNGIPNHTGIVEKVEHGRVFTIEGNSEDRCAERIYPVGYYEILGYGIPAY